MAAYCVKKAKIFWRSILNKLREDSGKKVFARILFFRKNDEVRENCGIKKRRASGCIKEKCIFFIFFLSWKKESGRIIGVGELSEIKLTPRE